MAKKKLDEKTKILVTQKYVSGQPIDVIAEELNLDKASVEKFIEKHAIQQVRTQSQPIEVKKRPVVFDTMVQKNREGKTKAVVMSQPASERFDEGSKAKSKNPKVNSMVSKIFDE